jgi:hypothetical protein
MPHRREEHTGSAKGLITVVNRARKHSYCVWRVVTIAGQVSQSVQCGRLTFDRPDELGRWLLRYNVLKSVRPLPRQPDRRLDRIEASQKQRVSPVEVRLAEILDESPQRGNHPLRESKPPSRVAQMIVFSRESVSQSVSQLDSFIGFLLLLLLLNLLTCDSLTKVIMSAGLSVPFTTSNAPK